MGIYIMIATGIWFHESENLSTDAAIVTHNSTGFATWMSGNGFATWMSGKGVNPRHTH